MQDSYNTRVLIHNFNCGFSSPNDRHKRLSGMHTPPAGLRVYCVTSWLTCVAAHVVVEWADSARTRYATPRFSSPWINSPSDKFGHTSQMGHTSYAGATDATDMQRSPPATEAVDPRFLVDMLSVEYQQKRRCVFFELDSSLALSANPS